MCTTADNPRLREKPQKELLEKRVFVKLQDNAITNGSVYRNEKYMPEKSKCIKKEPSSVKITLVHIKEERIILKVDEDSSKPWYFIRV